ncbi:hypothetical protein ACWFRB_00570 [Rhodococcus sp. NPDC055112]
MADPTNPAEVSKWADMAEWLVDSLTDKPVAFILEMGPSNYLDRDDEEEVVCAQIHVLADGVLLLRRSRVVLRHLMFADHSTDGLVLDRWHFDDHFEDCTDGYIFSRDTRLVADTCVTWFRDNWGTRTTDELGCSYEFPDTLPVPDRA